MKSYKGVVAFFLVAAINLSTGSLWALDNRLIDKIEIASQKENEGLVTGQVIDQDGSPLVGVTVYIKGTLRGVVTNIDGNFAIKTGAIKSLYLVFSFVGMKQQEVLTESGAKLKVVMHEDKQLIDDVVVRGAYGTAQKRSDMVGSAYQVTTKQLETLPSARVDLLLDGLVPGIQIEPNTDSPASIRSRYNVRVRGSASLSASNEPLWIVDGTPIYTGDRTNMVPGMSASISPLTFINPDDIESITVLKDASATSIYGANGANGVILVSTKSGKQGKARFKVTARYGVSKISESTKFKVLNAEQYMELAKESYQNAGLDMRYFPFQDNELNSYSSTSTDWYDVYYGIGSNMQGNLSLTGGTEKASYYLSGSYYRSDLTVKGNTQERFSVRANTSLKLSERLSAKFNLSASYNINELFNPGKDYYEFLPIFTPYNADGSYRLYNRYVDGKDLDGNLNWKDYRFFNSVAEREENDNRQRAFASNSNLSIKYTIIDGLTLTSQIGVDYQSNFEDIYEARTNWGGMATDGTPLGYSRRAHVNFLTWTNIDRLNFSKTYGKHKVGGLAGFEISSKQYNTVRASGSGFVNDHIKEIGYAVNQDGSSSASIDRAMSFFLQGSYSFDSRYYLTINGRKDGNSSFGKDVRWVNFGSVGASWNIHNEAFFNSDVINVFKVKTSFGSNGNSRLGAREAQGAYSYNESDRYMNLPGGSMSSSPNAGLSWETTYMTNVGVRLKLFDCVDIDAEWYNNKTVNLLSNLDVSRTTGDTRVYRNVGSIRNSGVEVTIISDNIQSKNFNWTTNLNLSHNKNRLLELYNGIEKVMGNKIWREGYDINTYYVVRWAGVNPRDGAPLWYDIDGNITSIFSYANRVPGKSSTPDLTGGMINTFQYKNFDLSIVLNYAIGGHAYSSFGRGVSSDGLNIMSENQSVNQLDRWQKPGDLASAPKPIWGISTGSTMNSTRYIYNRTNMRLQNVALTYHLPKALANQIGLRSCGMSFIADNIAVWTPYDKKDRNSYRQSMSGYPMETSFSLSLDLQF